jgi:hypothetical protein
MRLTSKEKWALFKFLAAVTWLIFGAGCPVSYTALVAHKDACTAKGQESRRKSEAEGVACWVAQARLQHIVDTDPDCRAYWEDAGVDLQCDASRDGGTDGRD